MSFISRSVTPSAMITFSEWPSCIDISNPLLDPASTSKPTPNDVDDMEYTEVVPRTRQPVDVLLTCMSSTKPEPPWISNAVPEDSIKTSSNSN